jgi:beta-N-acetylhexosaminidase
MKSIWIAAVSVVSLLIITLVFQENNLHTAFLSSKKSPAYLSHNIAMTLPMRSDLVSQVDPKTLQQEVLTKNPDLESKYSYQEYSKKSLETQAGQLLIVGLAEKHPTEELRKFLFSVRPGGFVLFRRNYDSIQELYMLIRFLKKTSSEYSGLVPLIAVDEEGGAVTRLPWKNKLPSAYMLAQLDEPDLTRAYGVEVGKVLMDIGINMNFAPVLDLSLPNQFLKTRSYGNSERRVTTHGLAYAEGLTEVGVIPVAKHFPGLSPSTQDPHYDKTQRVFRGPKDFLDDIAPFFKFSKKFASSGVMLSHSIYPQFNPVKSAVMSPELVSYLKKDLKYAGIVVSDDLQMQGISYQKEKNVGRIQTIIKESFEAGCDIMMLSFSKTDQRAAHQQLLSLLVNPKNQKKTMDKLTRILNLKKEVQERQSTLRKIASEESQILIASKIENGRITSPGLEKLNVRLQQLKRKSH